MHQTIKKIIVTMIITLIPGIVNAIKNSENSQSLDLNIKFSEYEKIMESYFRGDPRGAAVDNINRLVNEYNNWFSSRKNALDAQQEKLNDEFNSINDPKKQIDALDEKLVRVPDPTDEKAVKAYNDEMSKRNAIVEKYNKLAKVYKEHEAVYNNSVKEFESEIAARKEKLEAQKRKLMEDIQALDQWFQEKMDQEFFTDLNKVYGELIEKKRSTRNSELDSPINKLQSFRHELGTYTITKQNKAENGLIVVPATFGSKTESFFIVDTGASLVTITPELVKVLGLSDRVGKEIETSLAGGITAKGQEIVIPLVSVYGKSAQDVQAIILPSSTVGVDGLLGRSFLKRFIVRIDDAAEPKLGLEYRK